VEGRGDAGDGDTAAATATQTAVRLWRQRWRHGCGDGDGDTAARLRGNFGEVSSIWWPRGTKICLKHLWYRLDPPTGTKGDLWYRFTTPTGTKGIFLFFFWFFFCCLTFGTGSLHQPVPKVFLFFF
jgi:hypothetical protein